MYYISLHGLDRTHRPAGEQSEEAIKYGIGLNSRDNTSSGEPRLRNEGVVLGGAVTLQARGGDRRGGRAMVRAELRWGGGEVRWGGKVVAWPAAVGR